MNFTPRILILPGLGNSGEQHWQSIWERQYPDFSRINQQNWDNPVCRDWIEQIDRDVMAGDPSNVILVGHSLACTAIAYWAQTFQRTIRGALLVAPSDTEADTYPPGTTGFIPVPLLNLPFPSTVVTSTDDYYVTLSRATFFARSWGSKLVVLDAAGHINAGSGYGNWPEGLALLRELDTGTVS
ncbi:RBBP9/YdeN family alpha/beta hydrolase [Larkinella insperata]|uniref:RBBP9/YdeN family alpha/beta hydrolase n=1 Tax=Larkinella insperata TaxID=332158 RepID=A0ABW3QMU8_9BACT|nr:alpha/beta fold hydrolase [Larkinella insperata]